MLKTIVSSQILYVAVRGAAILLGIGFIILLLTLYASGEVNLSKYPRRDLLQHLVFIALCLGYAVFLLVPHRWFLWTPLYALKMLGYAAGFFAFLVLAGFYFYFLAIYIDRKDLLLPFLLSGLILLAGLALSFCSILSLILKKLHARQASGEALG